MENEEQYKELWIEYFNDLLIEKDREAIIAEEVDREEALIEESMQVSKFDKQK